MSITPLLQVRAATKGKKPVFTRQEYGRKRKIGIEWRKPKGMHSKMRLHIRGKKRSPSPGWGSPREVEGLHPSGLRPVLVATAIQIDAMQEGEGAVISSTVGMRKRVALVEHAKKKNAPLLNLGDVDKFLKQISEQMAQRKAAKKKVKAAQKKEEPKKEEKKESEEVQKDGAKAKKGPSGQKDDAQAQEQKPSGAEQKKEKEKEERDKLLTKRV